MMNEKHIIIWIVSFMILASIPLIIFYLIMPNIHPQYEAFSILVVNICLTVAVIMGVVGVVLLNIHRILIDEKVEENKQ